jgi:DNA primase
MFKFDREWIQSVKRGVERIRGGMMFTLKRIPETDFRGTNDKGKRELLKREFERLMEACKVDLNNNLLCPYHDDYNPSFRYYSDTKKFYCFSRCFEDEGVVLSEKQKSKVHKDAFDLIGDMYGLIGFKERYNMLVSLFAENPDKFYKTNIGYQHQDMKKVSTMDKGPTSFARMIATKDPEVKVYLNNRGFSDEMIQLFHLEAIEENGRKFASVLCDKEFEVRRNIHFKPKDKGDTNGKYINRKGQSVGLFNSKDLKLSTANEPVFCVESAFDALIIKSFGFLAVATNSTSSVTKLVEKCIEMNNGYLRLILLFDFDEAGQRASKQAYRQLKDVVDVISFTIESGVGPATFLKEFKDIGEAFRADSVKTEKAIRFISLIKSIRLH